MAFSSSNSVVVNDLHLSSDLSVNQDKSKHFNSSIIIIFVPTVWEVSYSSENQDRLKSKHLKGCSGPAWVTLFGEFPFLDTFGSKIGEKVSRNRRNDKKCLEMGENENPFAPIYRHF